MDDVRRKVYLDLFATPGTLLPIAGGLTAWMASWAMGGDLTLNLVGLAGTLTGIGVMATRLIVGLDSITQRAYEHTVDMKRREQDAVLDQLHLRLEADHDPRTENCLKELRHLFQTLEQDRQERPLQGAALEIFERAESLFRLCVEQLDKSADLWETARAMKGPAKLNLLQQREQIVLEVCDATVHLGRTVDDYHAVTSRPERHEMQRIRRELDEALRVAREVQRRQEQLIDPHPTRDGEIESS